MSTPVQQVRPLTRPELRNERVVSCGSAAWSAAVMPPRRSSRRGRPSAEADALRSPHASDDGSLPPVSLSGAVGDTASAPAAPKAKAKAKAKSSGPADQAATASTSKHVIDIDLDDDGGAPAPKRSRNAESGAVIDLDGFAGDFVSDDVDFKDLLAQLDASKAAAPPAGPVAGPSGAPADADMSLARRLQAEYDREQADFAVVSAPAPVRKSKARAAAGAPPTEESPTAQLVDFRELFQGTKRCLDCGTKQRGSTLDLKDKQLLDTLRGLASVTCHLCQAIVCRGCMQRVLPGANASVCCSSVRFVMLVRELCHLIMRVLMRAQYHVLCALDAFWCATHLKKPSTPAEKAKKVAGSGRGTGYGGGGGAHAHYQHCHPQHAHYQHYHPHAAKAAPKQPARDPREVEADAMVCAALRACEALLPDPEKLAPLECDLMPHPRLAQLLLASTLTECLAEYLRNDSIDDACVRSDCYWAVLGVLTRLSTSEATLAVLTQPRPEKRYSDGLRAWVAGSGTIEFEREGQAAAVAPTGRGAKKRPAADDAGSDALIVKTGALFDHLTNLLKQSRAYQKLEGAAAEAGKADEATIANLMLAGDLIVAGEHVGRAVASLAAATGGSGVALSARDLNGIEAAAPASTGKRDKGKGKATAVAALVDVDKLYADRCLDLAFDTLDDGKILVDHLFRQHRAAASANAKLISKEVISWTTSLPPGCWVRMDESRRDLLRALIAAPADTPYAFGLFEFDLFLPPTYPDVAPSCLVRTTAGGRWRSNPNLYAEGKVCLSLLGTWAGTPEEMWQPRRSTILQVLTSIQSMIIGTDCPFRNEPAWGNEPKNSARARAYNRDLSLQTVRWAIVDWLGDKGRASIFKDVVKMHFETRAPEVRAQLATWAKDDGRLRAYAESTLVQAGPYYHHRGRAPAAGAGGATMDLVAEFDSRQRAF